MSDRVTMPPPFRLLTAPEDGAATVVMHHLIGTPPLFAACLVGQVIAADGAIGTGRIPRGIMAKLAQDRKVVSVATRDGLPYVGGKVQVGETALLNPPADQHWPGEHPTSLHAGHPALRDIRCRRYRVSPKLDGVRYLVVLRAKWVDFVGRDERVHRHACDLPAELQNVVLDGELLEGGTFAVTDVLSGCRHCPFAGEDGSRLSKAARIVLALAPLLAPALSVRLQAFYAVSHLPALLCCIAPEPCGTRWTFDPSRLAGSASEGVPTRWPVDGFIFTSACTTLARRRDTFKLKFKETVDVVPLEDGMYVTCPSRDRGAVQCVLSEGRWRKAGAHAPPAAETACFCRVEMRVARRIPTALLGKVVECYYELEKGMWFAGHERRDKRTPNARRTFQAIAGTCARPLDPRRVQGFD